MKRNRMGQPWSIPPEGQEQTGKRIALKNPFKEEQEDEEENEKGKEEEEHDTGIFTKLINGFIWTHCAVRDDC